MPIHSQPKEDKTYFVTDIEDWVRNKTDDANIELPSLINMTRKDLTLLAHAIELSHAQAVKQWTDMREAQGFPPASNLCPDALG